MHRAILKMIKGIAKTRPDFIKSSVRKNIWVEEHCTLKIQLPRQAGNTSLYNLIFTSLEHVVCITANSKERYNMTERLFEHKDYVLVDGWSEFSAVQKRSLFKNVWEDVKCVILIG